ncbi:glycerol-3-phosphate 1-O-acyltransferase PlsY [Oxalobacter aliiformigenes]|jgi:acyl phosphate:glycerol-3-phosphate acyltransferase|uniref:Glycerol-3-phosphate acyltransferase n=1 Tax=Oxalobacter aliiformigenes TaxID=2946593 RepID=A0ABY7JL75_9BURK|nr:glycerol-3-phosphate 1-O-acyltransferase PlsY [Oxalobacter aliiformigenes]WAV89727.1 glycerol-3-phosphate 1-O-acyltransferase PlsY [Oxalobacter aliiformigenes]WAV93833.1 glycerol-3-phosphate 1-O-acyltransferase PlsY [Oxalobacter aliiformigenes]WAV94665.1 glycerol-3-phosphate 1-O-acyltransferase PlsY [Oxalobacter aliiformigenes]WAV97528.1 glycerol-3-phosphate 1-O-acyltransferase PlsY [Oxalobacter aliiformigenes]
MYTVLFVIAAYLLGSISFALVSSRLFGLADPRTYGSKNPGATNVLRSGNKLAALLTLVGDAAKGWLAVWLAFLYGGQFQVGQTGIACVCIAVFLGHLFPVFARFRGGKGVATALGVLLGISPLLGLAVLATWLCVALLTRYSSLSALVSAVLAPIYYGLLYGFNLYFAAIVVISAFLIGRHRQNIGNLLSGKESKIGSKKKAG